MGTTKPIAAAAARKTGVDPAMIEGVLSWTTGILIIALALWWLAWSNRLAGLQP